jgi:hypothetical protein
MNEITYQNKVALNENPEIADINKTTYADMNEIKSVVNTNSQISSNNFGLGTDTWSSSATYSIGDIVVYNDNTYKNLTGTNTTTTPDQDNTNWEVMPLIVDEYNTSTKNAYSSNQVNKLIQDTYSTNEVKTNKVWIDGKPIYRKVFVITSQSTDSIDVSDLNIDYLNIYATIEYDAYKRPMYTWGANDERFQVFYNGAIQIRINNVVITDFKKIIIVIEYTKTTD